MFGALRECVAWRQEVFVEVTRAEKSELLARRCRGSAPGGISTAPHPCFAIRTALPSAAAAAAVDELRDRGVGDGDEVP